MGGASVPQRPAKKDPAEAVLSALNTYDLILLNSSGGKDSMASLDLVATEAERRGMSDRLVVGHAGLGRVEWDGTEELARAQAERYGLRFEIVRARGPDLLDRVERRGLWPSARQRWCTSDLKRGPLYRLMTKMVAAHRARHGPVRVRLLSVMGMRAEESAARAKRPVATVNERASNSRREVTDFLPLHGWRTAEVWRRIRSSRIADLVHPAYGAGMPRLSCRFCILASKSALVTAARLNPDLAREYLRVEQETGHRFRQDLSMEEIVEAADRGECPTPAPWQG